MWARSMTLAIRKLKCWVNAILPMMFIKEMKKLVTLRMKHDQKANLKSAPPPPSPFVACCTWASCSVHEWHHIYNSVYECVHGWSCKCQDVCEAMRYGCFTSRWLIAPLPPPGAGEGSGTGALRWTDCVTGRGGTKQTVLGRCTRPPSRLQGRESEQAWWMRLWPLWHSTLSVTQWFLNYPTKLDRWKVAKVLPCL